MKTLITILLLTLSTFAADLSAPRLTAPENGKVNVPVYVKGCKAIIAFQFDILFDNDVITPIGDRDNNFGCAPASLIYPMNVLCNVYEDGRLSVVAWGATNFSGSGAVITTHFTTSTGATLLDFENVRFFDQGGPVSISASGGEVVLLAGD